LSHETSAARGPDEIALSIVIPAFNEHDRLPRACVAIRRYLEERAWTDAEVVVVDDGSTDGTATVVRDAALTWPQLRLVSLARNSGKGAAVRAGVNASLGRAIAFTDADLSTDLALLDTLLADLAFADVAIASRAVPGARIERHQSLLREGIAKLYGVFARALLFRGVPDSHCGLKAFRADAARAIYDRVGEDRGLFDSESMLVAALQGRSLTQRPATWRHDPDSRMPMSARTVVHLVTGIARLKLRHRSLWPPRVRDVTPRAAR
jgi:dolichyl-phosphate beta-glucosyltransferase